MTGQGVTLLEDDIAQPLLCTVTSDSSFEFVNQGSTKVVQTYVSGNLLIYIVDQVLAFPGTYSEETSLNNGGPYLKFEALRAVSGSDSLDDTYGITAFVPTDAAFTQIGFNFTRTDLKDVFNNHVSCPVALPHFV